MNWALYPVFLVVAGLTVLSPGPGVVMTLSNALRFGLRGTLGGILGIACGAAVVAGLSATGMGVLLATSATAFTVAKGIGALYLFYLGVKLWRAAPLQISAADEAAVHAAGPLRRFGEGITLQLSNPKAIFFFLSVLPQFIAAERPYLPQFTLLVGSYAALVVLIHCAYALGARAARGWLSSERGGRLLNRGAGLTFMGFGLALALARRPG